MAAMWEEIGALHENETWVVTDLPKERKAVKNEWVYKPKRELDGTVERLKTRLAVTDYSQRFGINFKEVYSSVVRYKSNEWILIRLFSWSNPKVLYKISRRNVAWRGRCTIDLTLTVVRFEVVKSCVEPSTGLSIAGIWIWSFFVGLVFILQDWWGEGDICDDLCGWPSLTQFTNEEEADNLPE